MSISCPKAAGSALAYNQITDDLSNPDSLSTPRHSCAALYDCIAPRRTAPAAPDVWHHSRIIAHGLHIEHWLDGEKVIDVDLDSPAAEASFALSQRSESKVTLRRQARRLSPIALQIHDGIVAFRDIKIRPLSIKPKIKFIGCDRNAPRPTPYSVRTHNNDPQTLPRLPRRRPHRQHRSRSAQP